MASDIDTLNYYDPLLEGSEVKMSQEWINNISNLVQNLQDYLSSYGIFVPQITEDSRDLIQSPVNGQMIYNTTANKVQVFENGSWQNVV